MTAVRPIASSPMRLWRSPPPITMRSVFFHSFSRRKRRITEANSCENSSIAPWTMPAASGSPSASTLSSCFLLIVLRRRIAERIVAGLAQPLAPVVEDRLERALAGAIADKAFGGAHVRVVGVHGHAAQLFRAVSQQVGGGVLRFGMSWRAWVPVASLAES